MNHKMIQPGIILILVSFALIAKGILNNRLELAFVGAGVLVLGILRVLLMRNVKIRPGTTDLERSFVERYFADDPVYHVELLHVYKTGVITMLYEEVDGILFYEERTDCYFGSAKTRAGAKDIVHLLPIDYRVFVAQEPLFEEFMGTLLPFKQVILFYNHVYEKTELVEYHIDGVDIQPLEERHLAVVEKHYTISDLFHPNYLKERIQTGMLGAFVDGELAGFIGVHDNGAMGMLEVFPQYEGRYIGTYLQVAMMNYLLEDENHPIVYSQVNENNEVSLHIQQKLAMTRAKEVSRYYIS